MVRRDRFGGGDVQRTALNELFGPKLASFNPLVVEPGNSAGEHGIPFVSAATP